MREQERRNDPSNQNIKPSRSKSFPPCPHCQRTNHPPEKCWSGPNAAIRPKRFTQEYYSENRNDGQEQGNLTHSGPSSILKNHSNTPRFIPLYQQNPKNIKEQTVNLQHLLSKTYCTMLQSQPFVRLNQTTSPHFHYKKKHYEAFPYLFQTYYTLK